MQYRSVGNAVGLACTDCTASSPHAAAATNVSLLLLRRSIGLLAVHAGARVGIVEHCCVCIV